MHGDFFTVGSVLKKRVFHSPSDSSLRALFIIEISEKIIQSALPHIDPAFIRVLFYKQGKLIIRVSHNALAHELTMKEHQIRSRLPVEFYIIGFRYIVSN